MITCSQCKTSNWKGAKRCKRCGGVLALSEPPVVPCPRCGASNGADLRFCEKCGANTAPHAVALAAALAMAGKRHVEAAPAAEQGKKEGGKPIWQMALVVLCLVGVTLWILNKKTPGSASLPPERPPAVMINSEGVLEPLSDKEALALEPEPAPLPIVINAEAPPPPEMEPAPAPVAALPPVAGAPVVEPPAKPRKTTRPPPKPAVAPPVKETPAAPVPVVAVKKPAVVEARQCSELSVFYAMQCSMRGAALWFRCAPDGRNWNDNLPGCKMHDE